jgi:hypothetical protein
VNDYQEGPTSEKDARHGKIFLVVGVESLILDGWRRFRQNAASQYVREVRRFYIAFLGLRISMPQEIPHENASIWPDRTGQNFPARPLQQCVNELPARSDGPAYLRGDFSHS